VYCVLEFEINLKFYRMKSLNNERKLKFLWKPAPVPLQRLYILVRDQKENIRAPKKRNDVCAELGSASKTAHTRDILRQQM